jgi:hypothetical protein
MLVGVVKRGKYGERLIETIKNHTDFQVVSIDVPAFLPGFIEDPEEFVKELNLDPNSRFSWGFAAKVAENFLNRLDIFENIVYEKGSIAVLSDCPFKDGPIEICNTLCDFGPNVFGEAFAPTYETIMTSKLSAGDTECRWISKPRSQSMPVHSSELGQPVAMIVNWAFPKEIIDSFSIQYLAEFWVIATRALIDHAGGDFASVITRPYMEHSGISHGLHYRNSSKNDPNNNLRSITNCISSCELSLHMKGDAAIMSMADSEGTITECPFKDAPPEVCAQFESFCNGICEAIDPEFEFRYDRMMSRGDKTCHWTIRKKMGSAIGGKNEEAVTSTVSDDPFKALKLRFVQGEITEEEYRRMKKELEE